MRHHDKVVWSEGMFLRSQHFQQQDRYFERLLRQRVEGLRPFSWGLRDLSLDAGLLALGKVAVDRCSGVFEDGSPFSIPDDHVAPTPIDLPVGTTDTIVYLCVPVQQRGAPEVQVGAYFKGSARFSAAESEVADAINGASGQARIRTAALNLSLKLQNEDRSGFHSLGLARIAEVAADRRVRLDPAYIPPFMDTAASPTLSGFLTEVMAMLHHRGEALAPLVTGTSSRGVAEIADFLLLQLINRAEPLLKHFRDLSGVHPEQLYARFVELAGELSTFTSSRKRPEDYAVYRHDDLEHVFATVMIALRQSLSAVVEQSVVNIPLQDRKYGIRAGVIPDKTLLTSATFVLVVRASMPEEQIRRALPALIKIGPVEQIRELVNVQLPGIRVQPLAVVPRQLPYQSSAVYFELEPNSPTWKSMVSSGGIAVHLSGEFPDVFMELWAVRRK